MITSLARHFVPLQASPVGLLGRFAPSGLAFCACILLASLVRVLRFALTKVLKKGVSQSTQDALKRIVMQKKNYPFDPQSVSGQAQPYLPHVTTMQGPKEIPCQVSCRLVQNCGRWRDTYRHAYTHTHRQTYSPSFIV